MAGNRAVAEDLRQRLEKWRQDRKDAKQEAKAAQRPIFAVRHTGKVSSPPSASAHKKTRAATPSPRPITVPIRHQSRLAERHTISSANKRVQRNEAAPMIEAPAKCDEANCKPAGKYAPKHPSPLLYSRTASLECGSMHVTPPREYERRTEKPLLRKLLRRLRARANKRAKKKAKAARK